ncbi:MAG: hypothetical protein IJ776_06410 [Paludibacteraceae bacterium]|nr:hypothetical protein [Paludibacteraceae bacterium]
MIVKTADFLSELSGQGDGDYYLRRVPGKPEYSVKCRKPKLSKKKKKEYGDTERSRIFREAAVRAKAEYADAEKRVEWQRRYDAAREDLRKRGTAAYDINGKMKLPAYLWLYIRREIMNEMLADSKL